ncbi:MAPEG family protein [Microbulbifer epialgicus]|uniref:MAPEG family protein n=1 Tax=Microbulbifer epialgicus TaxID=393907 RepID=A0ABV4P584_9GAMM
MSKLPPRVRWKADNYNHLLEQPTVFYAIVLSLTFLDGATEVNIIASWLYVGLRILHSLVQVLWNKIEIRFVIFFLSNIPLFILAFNAAKIAF